MMPVRVANRPKGDVVKDRGRWIWFRPGGGSEVFPRGYTRDDLRAFIARVCLAQPADVKFGTEK